MRLLYVSLIIMSLVFAPDAHAYLDPGSGSMLLQVILGGLAAVGVMLKLWWYKILRFLGIRKGELEDEEAEDEEVDQE